MGYLLLGRGFFAIRGAAEYGRAPQGRPRAREAYAHSRRVPLRLGGQPGDDHVTLLKLHGSIDWTLTDHRRSDQPDEDFAALREMQNPTRAYTVATDGEEVLRIRAIENMNRS